MKLQPFCILSLFFYSQVGIKLFDINQRKNLFRNSKAGLLLLFRIARHLNRIIYLTIRFRFRYSDAIKQFTIYLFS
jgi:hypothetical protein